MRSSSISLEVKFAEAKAHGRLDGRFAATCLSLLRQIGEHSERSRSPTAGANSQRPRSPKRKTKTPELLESLADSLEELVFSNVPRLDGGTLDEGTLTWLELCKRTQEEKREEAMAKEALQLEAQELSAKVAALEEKVAVLEADSERERLLAEAERALVALRAEHAEQLAACEQREAELVATQQREVANFSRRLEFSESTLLRAQERIAAADLARSRRAEAATLASATLRKHAALPPPDGAAVGARLHAQLRALQLHLISAGSADQADVALACGQEADRLLGERGALPPAAARAGEAQQLLAKFMLDAQAPKPQTTGRAGSGRRGRPSSRA